MALVKIAELRALSDEDLAQQLLTLSVSCSTFDLRRQRVS